MFQYIKPTKMFDLVKNMGCRVGDGLVRLGPDTNCEFVCEEVTEEGVPISGCNGLEQCELKNRPVPCPGEVQACDPCYSCGSDAGGEGLTAEEVTAMIEEQVPAIAQPIAATEAADCIGEVKTELEAIKAAG